MLHGDHVDLRAIDLEDADELWRWFNDAQVMGGWGGRLVVSVHDEHPSPDHARAR